MPFDNNYNLPVSDKDKHDIKNISSISKSTISSIIPDKNCVLTMPYNKVDEEMSNIIQSTKSCKRMKNHIRRNLKTTECS